MTQGNFYDYNSQPCTNCQHTREAHYYRNGTQACHLCTCAMFENQNTRLERSTNHDQDVPTVQGGPDRQP